MRARSVQAVWGIGLLVGAVWACETTRNPGGIQRDLTPPTLNLTNTAGDTQDIAGGLRFNVNAADNLGLKTIDLIFSGGHIDTLGTLFTTTVTTFNQGTVVTFGSVSGAGGPVRIIGIATDGAGNIARDTLFIFLANVSALQVLLITPATGALASTGRGIPVEVVALQREGIRKIGFLVAPANAVSNPTTPPNDSLSFTVPYADSVRYVDTLIVVGTTGTFSVVGFAEDSTGRRRPSNVVTVTIQSTVTDVLPPVVSHIISSRVEVSDSVRVHATDPSAISWMGIRITDANGVLLRFDTVNVAAGNLTDQVRNFSLNLAGIVTTFPFSVVVRSYACDLAVSRNCAFSQNSTVISGSPGIGGPMRAPGTDTVVVVAGVTRPFPLAGTQIADAIFNANRNELYLTNPVLSRLEIFQVANTSFVAAGVPTVGPQPWGIALWPRDTLGAYRDTVVVANSGGTQLAVVDMGTRQLRWRQDLPNYTIQTYRVVQIGGGFRQLITSYDLSDRPQYVATVCRPTTGGGPACHADSVFALYSTTPTVSQPPPFVGRGTVRMEKLINTTNPAQLYGRFVWEISTSTNSVTADTLRIVLHRRVNNVRLSKVTLSACAGVTVELARMGLGDRTFARNSGNFTHAFLGEGGNVAAQFARVMSYDARDRLFQGSATAPLVPCPTDLAGVTSDSGEVDVDLGMSPGIDVSDFISNTATRVRSIATNFNGRTHAVRADSIYYLGEDLRLKATSIVPAGDTNAVGMDMNYFHAFAPSGQCPPDTPACGGTGSPNDRLIFTARPDGNIDVFDTFFGAFVGSLPVRDPIIGPLRVARDATGQLLFGVTGRGLVTVRVPAYVNPFPAPPRGRRRAMRRHTAPDHDAPSPTTVGLSRYIRIRERATGVRQP